MIMEAIYKGTFVPVEDVNPKDPRYNSEWEAADKLLEALQEKLSSADNELLKQLLEHSGSAHCMENEEFFKLGLSAGLQLQKEVTDHLQYLNK